MTILRPALKVLGALLVLAALTFVGLRVAQNVGDLRAVAARAEVWLVIATGAVLYGILGLLLTFAWKEIMTRAGAGTVVTFRASFEIYGRSQIAKYIPGNVFHFFGRQLLGRDAGWTQGSIAVASVVETLCLGSAAAALLLALGALDRSVLLMVVPPSILATGAVAAIAGPTLLLRYGPRVGGLRRLGLIAHAEDLGRGLALAPPFLAYVVFFLAAAVVFWALIAGTFGSVSLGLVPGVAAAFVSGWLIGNVTPSAPGGIGVREAVMLPQLGALIGEPHAVAVVLMFRLVTIGGDVLFFLAATWLAYRRPLAA